MKSGQRKRAKEILLKMTEEQILDKSRHIGLKISKFLADLIPNSNDQMVVGVFSPIRGEVKWYEGLDKKLDLQFAAAHVTNQTDMEFHTVDLELIKSGEIGFKIRDEYKNIAVVPKVMLIPGLAFTKECERLGRGGGYYDRFLEIFPGLKIGLCFEEQIFDEIVTEDTDVTLDMIITDKNIYKKDK